MRLGKLIERLELEDSTSKVVIENRTDEDQEFANLLPVGYLCSWRGDYSKLSVSPAVPSSYEAIVVSEITVGQFLKMLRDADGGTFEGWKGGEYRMSDYTQVWGDEEGRSTGNYIVGIRSNPGYVVLRTEVVQ